jgi:ABC-type uncharacterized transport system ATPase subunit
MSKDKYFYQYVSSVENDGTINISVGSCDNNEKEINKVKNKLGYLAEFPGSRDVYNKNMTKYLTHLSKMKKNKDET